jgi:hypothetical protein
MRRTVLLAAALLATTAAAAPAARAAGLPPIRHVFVIVLENKGFSDTFGPTGQLNAPYLAHDLPAMGQLLTRYYGTGHSSADNYMAMVAGQPPTPASQDDCPDPLQKVPGGAGQYNVATGDGCMYPRKFPTIADQLVEKGFTWRGYNQDIPAPCSLLKSKGDYARKHNPWVFFQSLRLSGECKRNDVGLEPLTNDLASEATTPNLVYIVPNQCDDGHSACPSSFPVGNPITDDQDGLKQADAFLKTWVPKILDSPAYKKDGLLIINFDEAVEATACCNEQPGAAAPMPGRFGPGGGDTGAVLISPVITAGTYNTNEYNHYSLLRSLEDLFGLGHLGFAAQDGLVPFGDDVYAASALP